MCIPNKLQSLGKISIISAAAPPPVLVGQFQHCRADLHVKTFPLANCTGSAVKICAYHVHYYYCMVKLNFAYALSLIDVIYRKAEALGSPMNSVQGQSK